MSISSYSGANVEIGQHTFAQLIGRTNQLIYDMSAVVLTAAAVAAPNTTNGAVTSGNTYLNGMFGANTVIATNAIRGGTHTLSGMLTISSDFTAQGSANIAGPTIQLGASNTTLIHLVGDIATNITPRSNNTIRIGALDKTINYVYANNVRADTQVVTNRITAIGNADSIILDAVRTGAQSQIVLRPYTAGGAPVDYLFTPTEARSSANNVSQLGLESARWAGLHTQLATIYGNARVDGTLTVGNNVVSSNAAEVSVFGGTGIVNLANTASAINVSTGRTAPVILTIGGAGSTTDIVAANGLTLSTSLLTAASNINIGSGAWLGTLNLGRPGSLLRSLANAESTSTTTGSATFAGGVGIAKRLNVGGATALTGALTGSTYNFSGAGVVRGAFTANSTMNVVGAATFGNNATIQGTLDVAGQSTFNTVIATGQTTLSGHLLATTGAFSGNVSTGALTAASIDVTGSGRVRGSLTADNNVTVLGGMSVAGNTAIAGFLTGSNFEFSDSGRIRGNLTVDGNLTLTNSSIELSVATANQNDTTINNTLTLLGTANSHIIPTTAGVFDIGRANSYWRSIYSNEVAVKSGSTGYAIFRNTSNYTVNRYIDLPNGNVTLRPGSTAVLSDKFTAMAGVTSAELLAAVSGTRGTGDLVFSEAPMMTSPDFSGDISIRSGTSATRKAQIVNNATANTTITLPLTSGTVALTSQIGNAQITINGTGGISGSGTFNANDSAATTITLSNNDRGSSQNIFKGISNAAGEVQFSANNNNDAIRFASTEGLTIGFSAATKQITFGLSLEQGDGIRVLNKTTVSVDNTVVRTSRNLIGGDGIVTAIGDLSADRTIAVDNTVVRTSRTLTAGWGVNAIGNLSANRTVSLNQTELDTRYAQRNVTLTGGDGIVTAIGDLSSNRTIAVDNTVVRTINDQVIAGRKTFAGWTTVRSPSDNSTNTAQLNFASSNGTARGLIFTAETATNLYLRAYAEDGAAYSNAVLTPAGRFSSTSFAGIGTELTSLDASNLDRGTIPDARISSAIARSSVTLSGGDGITSVIGNLSGNRTISVDATVARTSTTLSGGWGITNAIGNLSANRVISVDQADLDSRYALRSLTFTGGDGIVTAIGNLTGNRTIAVDSTVLRSNANVATSGWIRTDAGTVTIRSAGALQTLAFRDSETDAIRAFVRSNGETLQLYNYTSDGTTSTTLTLTAGGYVQASGNGFAGIGTSITGISAANIDRGTLADARLTGNVVLTYNPQTINGTKTFGNVINAPGFNATNANQGFWGVAADSLANPSFTWTGDSSTGIMRYGAGAIGFATGGTLGGRVDNRGFIGAGTYLTNLNADNLDRGTVPAARLDAVRGVIAAYDAGTIGTYMIATINGNGSRNVYLPGTRIAGSRLKAASVNGVHNTGAAALAGTWECRGQVEDYNGWGLDKTRETTLWVRVA